MVMEKAVWLCNVYVRNQNDEAYNANLLSNCRSFALASIVVGGFHVHGMHYRFPGLHRI